MIDISDCYSYTDVVRKMGWPVNGYYTRKAKALIEGYDTSHFDPNRSSRKYERIKKSCPVCNKEFEALKGHPKEKSTCSYSCSNKHFRSGPSHPNWSEESSHDTSYRSTCFHYHGKRCLICEEEKIVEVHHVDGDRSNNRPSNLVPLCPTHHQYWHSIYRHEVEGIVINYLNSWARSE